MNLPRNDADAESQMCIYSGRAAPARLRAAPFKYLGEDPLTSATVKCIFVYQQLSSMIAHISPEDQTHALSSPPLRRLVSGAN